MKTKKARQAPRAHPALDLFGEVPITHDDIAAWVVSVAGISPDSWRFGYYVENWNVANKVRAAKLDGTFEATIRPPERRGILRTP